MRVRGLLFRDEDDALDYFVQRDIDEMTEIEFDEQSHTYKLNGAQVPSVTQIIKPLVKEGGSDETRDYKRQIGKALDAAISMNERNTLDIYGLDPAIVPFFDAWLKFKRESGFRVLLNQCIVYSKKLRFAGQLDLLGTRAEGPPVPDELLDTKCVWTMDPATAIQTAGYDLGLRESHGIKVKKRGGVQLLRDGTYRYYPYTDPLDEQVFKSCLSILSWKRLHP